MKMKRKLCAAIAAVFWAGVAGVATAQSSNIVSYSRPTASQAATLGQDAARLLAHPPRSLKGETDLACMAVGVYHESRGESIEGQRAVASVVLQRSLIPDRWGSTPCEVMVPVQFSFFTPGGGYAPILDKKSWETALRVSLTILLQGPDANIMGADHYHTPQVFPTWRKAMDMVAQIGNHKFYVDPISVRKTAEYGIETRAAPIMAFLPSSPTGGPSQGAYDWSGTGTPQRTGDGVRSLDPAHVRDLYASVGGNLKKPRAVATNGGFSPVRGPDVDAIAKAQGPRMGIKVASTGSPLGLKAPVDVAARSFKPLGLSTTTP